MGYSCLYTNMETKLHMLLMHSNTKSAMQLNALEHISVQVTEDDFISFTSPLGLNLLMFYNKIKYISRLRIVYVKSTFVRVLQVFYSKKDTLKTPSRDFWSHWRHGGPCWLTVYTGNFRRQHAIMDSLLHAKYWKHIGNSQKSLISYGWGLLSHHRRMRTCASATTFISRTRK